MHELMINLDMDRCLYEQIYEHIKKEIREGKLLAGEKLPSTRYMANYLQISRSTLEMAYAQLLAEGYIQAKPRKGYYICGLTNLLQIHDKQPYLPIAGESVGKSDQGKQQPFSYRYDFSPHGIGINEFPVATWKKISRDVLAGVNNGMFSMGDPQGDGRLRETISRYLHSARGVNCTPEQIVIGAGNDYLLMLLEKIFDGKREIAMETPTYMRAYRIFKSFQWKISVMPLDEQGMSVDALAGSSADIAYVMPSHQFPTGIVMPIARRMELLGWAMEGADRYLIEDDYDSEFRYRGKPIPSLQASDRYDKVIYLGTFSKSIAPAIRISYMVLPVPLLKQYREKCYFYSSTVSRIDQEILTTFIGLGYFERHVNKMRNLYREKHDVLLEAVRPLHQIFTVSGEHAGLHILLTAKNLKKEAWYIQEAKKAGIKVYGLTETSPGAAMPETILLGYGGLTKEEIIAGTDILKQVWLSETAIPAGKICT